MFARVEMAAELFHAGKVKRLVLSGDAREAKAMSSLALDYGVPEEALIVDPAGSDTFTSCYRANVSYHLNRVAIISQKFHLSRAIFTCNGLGIDAVGVPAKDPYGSLRAQAAWYLREIPATALAWWQVNSGQSLPNPPPTHFRSQANHLEVDLPAGWAASEGPESLTSHLDGLVAFNSWGQADFWARQVETQTLGGLSFSYSPEIIMSQIPRSGAYVVLVHIAGGPPKAPEDYGPEYRSQGLDALWARTDCRETGPFSADFFKWGRPLRLELYCSPGASEETVDEANHLLESWRFDRVPAGDIGWATVEARELLPPDVNPRAFPIITGGPTESYSQLRDIIWKTRAELLPGEVVAVTYLFSWDVPESGPIVDDCPPESCHWWRYEAHPDGEIVLVEEGGAALP